MLWSRRTFVLNKKQINILARFFCTNADEKHIPEKTVTPGYLARMLGSSHRNWAAALAKHKELYSVKREDLLSSAQALKNLNFTLSDILKQPMLLYLNTLTINNRYTVLKECGCETVSVSFLVKFVTVMNKNVSSLKSQGLIPFHVDVEERLRTCFTDINLKAPIKYGEDIKLKLLREHILNFYLTQRLDTSEKDLAKLWRTYSRVRHRSFDSVQRMVDILLNDLQFTKERIIKNAFVLYGDPDNVKRMLSEIKTINGQDFREILFRMPKVLMSSTDALVKTINHIKSFNIKEEAIAKCLEVLTLSPDTVLERLKDLQEVDEFQALCTNPRILRLVHYQNKARLRLDYLNQLKVRCASLHVLSCGSEAFTRFAREGSDRTKGRDVVIYLGNRMQCDEASIRSTLTRHPNWCHIPVLQVKQCYDILISKEFSDDDILRNLHVLLYPIKRIEEKLSLLNKPEFVSEMNMPKAINEISKSELLALVLYLIESEYHFTGDGIWTEQHNQQVENFHNILPDFPEGKKIYRYGLKEEKPSLSGSKTTTMSL